MNYHVYSFPEKIIKLSHILLVGFDKYTHDYGVIWVVRLFLKKSLYGVPKISHFFLFKIIASLLLSRSSVHLNRALWSVTS